ncbi:hypothetical protein SLV14_005623 [Streptomyces sp. Je 1-4]|uniref:hypothetical protein n=1 Tax=Streptomyces TaxID=1883 RepID=UPI0021D9C88D|nr:MULTISPECIES: hypothetical protein [unclassified Streptomyces]UYB42723.1 hypothetical protein SLV14_005623 [Streptomyces sp. Je 1-4]UZQ39048.1 hypothetical protein SLV14N_005623 [Streptomyces sp. Je 1-4] [Streptomyces sp. Je 1-4 4N24]UZQ46465.1 hypothetical protein SLV14NA_005623 [Streptomyces sp. Je 1-4] [Streptomyces sp. Je 1-4 4N24_ara]
MTICATEDTMAPAGPLAGRLTIAADGSYAARLARHDDAAGSWFPERWTLSGPEPYAVPLQGTQPEEPDSALLPLTDGRVLILRRVADRFAVSLLYPAGPGTGELLLGAVAAPRLTLLPPAPGGTLAYALAPGADHTTLWRVHGGASGPERVTRIPGRCTGGVWLDRAGRLLALDRELDGRTKTVVVDLERGGETGLLLQITEESNDRLLLADPDSGLLLLRSDAPGYDRLGWGVLGSSLPVRFPECLRPTGGTLTPFAVQPGQMLAPESCAVAFRMTAASGTWLGVWRPSERQLRQYPAPEGWLPGTGLWTADGELLLPYTTEAEPCGVARMGVPGAVAERVDQVRAVLPVQPVGAVVPVRPVAPVQPVELVRPMGPMGPMGPVRQVEPTWAGRSTGLTGLTGLTGPHRPAGPGQPPLEPLEAVEAVEGPPSGEAAESGGGIVPDAGDADNRSTASAQPSATDAEPQHIPGHPQMCRPVPLQEAPLAARQTRWSVISGPVRISGGGCAAG